MEHSIVFQIVPEKYGNIVVTPLSIANELNSELERWFQNYKYSYLAISQLEQGIYDKNLQVEYTYPYRIFPQRSFKEIKADVLTEVDLVNYQQLVKLIHKYIEKIHKLYLALTETPGGKNVKDFQDQIENKIARFNRKDFPTKLRILNEELESNISFYHLKLINRVRNCLEHRHGIISLKDCDEGKNYMSIRWRYPKISSSKGELTPISNIQGYIGSEINLTDEKKRFYKGDKIYFDFADNFKNISTLNLSFKPIIDSFYQHFNVKYDEKASSIMREINSI